MKRDGSNPTKLSRRSFALGGVTAIAVSGMGLASAKAKQATPTPDSSKQGRGLRAYPFLWSATSPATHKGDTYTLVIRNTTNSAQKILVRTTIMDHRAMQNFPVVTEELTVAPGTEETLTATNDYGTANHFATRILTQSDIGLDLQVSLTDASGQETATFNQGAFWIQDRQELRKEVKTNFRQRKRHRRSRRSRSRRHRHE